MGLPRKLINMNAFVDGEGYLGIVSEFEQPKLAIATEDHRGGGMLGAIKLDMGLEALEATMTMSGHVAALVRKFGTTAIDGVQLRLVGAYRADDGTAAQAVEIYLGGRFSEIDEGKTSCMVSGSCSSDLTEDKAACCAQGEHADDVPFLSEDEERGNCSQNSCAPVKAGEFGRRDRERPELNRSDPLEKHMECEPQAEVSDHSNDRRSHRG